MQELNLDSIYLGDAKEVLSTLPDNSIDCCVTSPPYFGLRDYGVAGQIGLEDTPEAFIDRLVGVFREVRRVLKPDGTLWCVIGDSYNGSGKAGNNPEYMGKHTSFGKPHNPKTCGTPVRIAGLKPKDLIGIPWRLALALQADGWWLRQDIIWHKPNPLPESVRDRCTKAHEYIFLLSKSPKYYYDGTAIAEPVADSTIIRCSQDVENQKGSDRVPGKTNGNMKACLPRYGGSKYTATPDKFHQTKSGNLYDLRPTRNKRSVWTVATKPCKEAHFATFPDTLILNCIIAGCPVGGVVLDPFIGSGTTAVVALKNDRRYVGIELNPEYIEIAERRISKAVNPV
jgi:DNA modification methylase